MEYARASRNRSQTMWTNVDTWTDEEAADFATAKALVSAVIAEYSALLHHVENPIERQQLIAKQTEHAQRRGRLAVTDRSQVQHIIATYPELLHRFGRDPARQRFE